MSKRIAALMAASVVSLAACSSGDTATIDLGGGDPDAGSEVFASRCSVCHGAGAAGSDQGPPLVHEYYVPDHHADVSFLLAVRNGVRAHHWDFGPMPAIPGLSDEDIADIVAYIRRLQVDAGLL